jgi:hypothetical protein
MDLTPATGVGCDGKNEYAATWTSVLPRAIEVNNTGAKTSLYVVGQATVSALTQAVVVQYDMTDTTCVRDTAKWDKAADVSGADGNSYTGIAIDPSNDVYLSGNGNSTDADMFAAKFSGN